MARSKKQVQQTANKPTKVINIMSLVTGELVAVYTDIEPKMALFAYTQGLKGQNNTWEYPVQIKGVKFMEGKHSVGLEDYACLKN